MFYRKDVLEELGLEIPNTWQELIEMLPTIQGNNMTIAIPTAAGSSATASASTSVASNAPDLSMHFSLYTSMAEICITRHKPERLSTVKQECRL